MANLNNDELFSQIRSAHRMVVAYYKRLFPIIREVATRLELSFYAWSPSEFDKPGQMSTNVLERWEWDMLPGACTNYLFFNAKNSNAQEVGEWMLDMHVITDTGMLSVDGEGIEKGLHGNQDPLEMEVPVDAADSVLRVYLFVPTRNASLNWYHGIWRECDYPQLTNDPKHELVDEDNQIYATGFEVSLSSLTEDNAVDLLLEKIDVFKRQFSCLE